MLTELKLKTMAGWCGQQDQDPRQLLAQRLRGLREERWPGRKITQPQLAQALGDGKRSVCPSSRPGSRRPTRISLRSPGSRAMPPCSPRPAPSTAPSPRRLSPADMTDEEAARHDRAAAGVDAPCAVRRCGPGPPIGRPSPSSPPATAGVSSPAAPGTFADGNDDHYCLRAMAAGHDGGRFRTRTLRPGLHRTAQISRSSTRCSNCMGTCVPPIPGIRSTCAPRQAGPR